jgi:SAM-dependent methyltransferase
MALGQEQIHHLGANASQYSQAMSEADEQLEFQWASKKIELLIKTLQGLPRRGWVADIGCRTGRQAAYYKEQAGIQEMHGFEISEVPLEIARQKGIVTHVWISGSSACPIENDFFDIVIAGDLIEHLVDTDAFLIELHRILKPDGYLLITTPNLAWWWSRFRFLFGKVPGGVGSVSFKYSKDRAVDKNHLRVSVNSEWSHLFKQYGFYLVSLTGYNYPKLLREPLNTLDWFLTQYPAIAHSNLFLLRKQVDSSIIS